MNNFDFLKVYNIDNKFRIGSKNDGGYIIVNNYKYDLLISGGISNDITFENDFVNKYNIKCYAFDGTINSIPTNNNNIIFIKKNIDNYNNDKVTDLKYLINQYDYIFIKMDIEGYEFNWLQSLSLNELQKLKQITIEFHLDLDNETSKKMPLINKLDILKKLSNTHYCIHFHGNSWSGTTLIGEKTIDIGTSNDNKKIIKLDKKYPDTTIVTFDYKSLFPIEFSYQFSDYNLIITRIDENNGWNHNYRCVLNGIQIPRVFECTYINKSLSGILNENTNNIPSNLDTSNTASWKPSHDNFEYNRKANMLFPDIKLTNYPYVK